MRYAYPCIMTLDEEEGEGFVVTFPDVPEAITGGKTREQALMMAQDGLAVALGMYVKMPPRNPCAQWRRTGSGAGRGTAHRCREIGPLLRYSQTGNHQRRTCCPDGIKRGCNSQTGQPRPSLAHQPGR